MFCVPIIASNTEEAINKMEKAGMLADVLEVRLDLMDSFDIRAIVSAAEKPVLITCRSVSEGGNWKEGPEKVEGHLMAAIEAGAEFADVELSMPSRIRQRILDAGGKTRIVISTHIRTGTPSGPELENIYRSSIAAGGDIVKIVTMAREWDDNLRTLELVSRASKEGSDIISFCMGPLGRMSRVFSVLMGACMTFASLEEGQESASGQIPIEKIKQITGYFST